MIVTADWVLPVCDPPLAGGAVALVGDVIVDVGAFASVRAGRPDDPDIIELPGRVIGPGLVNAHTHLSLSVLEGLTPRAPLTEWFGSVRPVALGLSPAEFGLSAALGASSCMRTGTTVVADVVYGGEGRDAASALGLGGAFCWELLGMDAGDMEVSLERRGFPPPGSGAESADGRTVVGLAPHTPYSAGPRLLTEAHSSARRHGAPFVIHVAESLAEARVIADGSGPLADAAARLAHGFAPAGLSPVGYLADLGVIDDAVCVHAVHVDRDDASILAARARGAVLCPRSNAWLGNGEPPIRMLRDAGVRLALGTDSSASNEDLDLFAEARVAREIDPSLSAAETLWMMTMAGAQVIGMAGSFGGLAQGAQADLVAVAADAGGDPVEAFLAGSAASVTDVMSAGCWRIRERRPLPALVEAQDEAVEVSDHAKSLVGRSGADRPIAT